MTADRNLLFGLLALQMDFLVRDQLLEAMLVWMLEKGTPLGEILCRRGVVLQNGMVCGDGFSAEQIHTDRFITIVVSKSKNGTV